MSHDKPVIGDGRAGTERVRKTFVVAGTTAGAEGGWVGLRGSLHSQYRYVHCGSKKALPLFHDSSTAENSENWNQKAIPSSLKSVATLHCAKVIVQMYNFPFTL